MNHLKCIWQFFFFCSIKSLQCTHDKYSKKIFDSDSPFPCFDAPKESKFTSGGVQNRETNNRRPGTIMTSFQDFKLREKQISLTFTYFLINNALLCHFVANWLVHNKKMTEKRLKSWNDVTIVPSVLFLVSRFCTSTRGEIWRFWYIKTWGRKTAVEYFSSLYLSVHWGDLIELIKKICHIQFKGATSRLAHLKTLSLIFSSYTFVIRVNLHHP